MKGGRKGTGMVIRELYIKNFGKFTERHFYLEDGVQVISGENEFGKSTLHAFIRAMLFGLERGRGRAAAKDAFTRCEPWENPGYYAGVMRFTCGGRNFRLKAEDRPGVLAGIASVFGNNNVSISQVILKSASGGAAELVVITDQVVERHFRDSLLVIKELSMVKEISSVLRVYG